MPEPTITLYGAHWCPDCRRSKQFLGEHQIPYNWIDIEEEAGSTKQVTSAAGEGATAALLIREYLKTV